MKKKVKKKQRKTLKKPANKLNTDTKATRIKPKIKMSKEKREGN